MDIKLSKTQYYLDWMKQKLYLDWKVKNTNSCRRKVQRGQVYYCELGLGVGNEEYKNRPCVIIQNNVGNINSPNTIVAPITNEAGEPKVTVEIKNTYKYIDENGKNRQLTGFVLLGNIATVSKVRLGNQLPTLTSEIDEIDEKILISLGMYYKLKNLHDTKAKDKKFIKELIEKNNEFKQLLDHLVTITNSSNYKEIISKIKY